MAKATPFPYNLTETVGSDTVPPALLGGTVPGRFPAGGVPVLKSRAHLRERRTKTSLEQVFHEPFILRQL